MIDYKSIRRYEELNRIVNRVVNIYKWIIINDSGEDSFQSPKEFILNFFRVTYELKENLKNDFPKLKQNIENEIDLSQRINIWIDIANKEKHWSLSKQRSDKKIWEINTNIHIFDPNWKNNRTEMTIEIDNKKIDCLILLKNIQKEREILLKKTL